MRIMFWNVEGISQNVVDKAAAAARRKELMARGFKKIAARHAGHSGGRAITRGAAEQVRLNLKSHGLSREARNEARAQNAAEAAERVAKQFRNKFQLSHDLPHSAPDVFFCEVVATHPNAQRSLPGPGAAGGATKCYAYYHGGASTMFAACPVTNGWYAGPAFGASDRVPKAVVLNPGGAGGPIRFCFWHAPSGNNGAIVAQMFIGLGGAAAGVAPFVLFGDLNSEPNQLVNQGVPPNNIINPNCMTRISGRCLDYAVTNVPNRVRACRPLNDAQYRDIKLRTGSDHMVMVLEVS